MSKFIEPSVEEIKLEKVYQDMGLSDQEYEKVCDILGRQPNFTETGIFSVMWSEHCSYKHSKPFLKQFPTSGDHVLMGPGEGAGVVDIGDNQAVVFKVESHNHPSAIEPYQGAATGVGGIIRDIVSIGARPINLLNSLRFGELDNKQNQRLLKGVVKGIGGYGNCIGIPTTAGEIEFDERYDGNPLVNAMCVGVINHDMIQKGTAKGVGNSVIYVGLKTGRDGIHGATFASEELTEESESKRPSVQIGDPFVGKKLMEATLEAITFDELVGIQDMGAAGLTSSSSEMAAKGGSGLHLRLEQVPTREPGISPYEMMLSETQERMLLVVEKGTEQKFLDLFDKHELDSAVIGEVTDTNRFVLTYDDEVYADIPVEPLADEAPVYILEGEEKDYNTSKNDYTHIDVKDTFFKLLKHPTIASKHYLYDQYDQQVGANTIIKPGLQASVVRVEGTNKAIASTIDGEARYVYNNPYEGGKMVVAEAYRNLIAVGATPLAMTDCLNYGSPEKKEIYQQLIDSTKGMAEACDILKTPVVSGNVSLYNETKGTSIFPTPVVGMVGLIENVNYLNDFEPQVGDKLYLIGDTKDDFGGSQLEKLIYGKVNHEFESLDLSSEVEKGESIKTAIREGLLSHVQTVGKGGLLITLAKLSAHYGLGLKSSIDITNAQLFSETQGRYVVSDQNELRGERGLGLLTEAIKDDQMERLKGYQHAIGHVRYATSGNKGIENIQPFLYHFYDMSVGICHNGNLINAKSLRQNLEKQGAIFHSSSDTEVIMHLIRRSKAPTFEEALKESLRKVKGGFTFAILTKDALYGAVDPNAIRPLVVGKMKDGTYILASETCAIDVLGAEFVQDIHAGEYVVINDKGITVKSYTHHTTTAISAMEYIYFARPDSTIAGKNVHAVRKASGKKLAQESPVNADMVIGVPNSSLSAASGYAEEIGLPYEMGLVKNQYVARTFIQPTQELREQGVRVKLSAVKDIVDGKNIILVDDSIVRGTTIRRIVKMLKDSGANKVHVRIASPEFMFPSFYGIDVSTTAELISASKSPEEIKDYIGADSLAYLSLDGLIESIGLDYDAPYSGLCVESFTGDYPAGLYDYEANYKAHLSHRQKQYISKNKHFFDSEGNLNV